MTLVRSAEQRCWGVAYRINSQVQHQVFDQLDYREKGGYEREEVHVHVASPDGSPSRLRAVAYRASAANPCFLGDAPIAQIARQIVQAEGPSGTNRDYLFRLASALRAAKEQDNHVFELERAVRALEADQYQ